MPFEFHLPSLEEIRSSPDGLEMLRMIEADNFESALITGCPGSGKTTLSIHRFLRLTAQNQRVYLLTFHNMLMLSLRGLSRDLNGATRRINTFHGWYRELTDKSFNFDNTPPVEKLREELNNTPLATQQQLEIILDEAQDLPMSVIEVLTEYFRRCVAGADDSQQVHKRFGARLSRIQRHFSQRGGPYVEKTLGRNFRNTYETYRFARQFIPKSNKAAWDETILERLQHENRRGAKPLVFNYRNIASRDQHLRTVLKNADGNVAILCPLGPLSTHGTSVDEIFSLVRGFGLPVSKYHNKTKTPPRLERYVVTTYISVKGLEFDTVVIPRINFFRWIPEEWFVACTRARKKLVVFRDLTNIEKDPLHKFDPETYTARELTAPSDGITSPF